MLTQAVPLQSLLLIILFICYDFHRIVMSRVEMRSRLNHVSMKTDDDPRVDDCFLTGPMAELLQYKKEIMEKMDCEDGGDVVELVGCKIDYDRKKKSMQIIQPVLLQSFEDEFEIAAGSELPKTAGVPLKTLQLGSAASVEGARNT
jgi:hypothetical protein